MNNAFFIKQLNDIITDFDLLKSKSFNHDLSGDSIIDKVSSLIVRSKATVSRITGNNSEYYSAIVKMYDDKRLHHDGLRLIHIIGIVSALKGDLENDLLISLHELVHAEIFSDYLDMSEYLLNEGFKDSSAVIVGSTLESHLRELCKKYGIEIEITNNSGKKTFKKADSMNADLARMQVYNNVNMKQITAWLSLRNSAAHGKYNEYNKDDIKLMISGIRNFMINYIA